jgi:membrane-anchored protein YejM (alkaline phosphatase superfamily)
LHPPEGLSARERDRQMELLESMNGEFRARHALQSAIQARTRAYELAARMQMSAPEAVDFASEPAHIRSLYGLDDRHTEEFGKQLLLARRLSERGVRFIQVCHAGGGNGGWDSHGDMKTHEPLCRATDRPIAGLLRDLKQRGMLDDTLVVWTSEFGRTPWSQNTTGRDHNPKGYTSWLAGGGVQGGLVHGATDDVGYRAVENPHYYSDLNATILHLLGLDHTRMELPALGPVSRLVERGGPIREILA